MNFGRSGKSASFGSRDTVSRHLAVESIQNIANAVVEAPSRPSSESDDEVRQITEILKMGPMAIAEVAHQLNWNSAKTAEALERGGLAGRLAFSREGLVTQVRLSE